MGLVIGVNWCFHGFDFSSNLYSEKLTMPKKYDCIGNCRGIRYTWNIGRVFCRVNPGLFRGFVGVFVGPVGVIVILLNVINLVSNFKTHENNDFYLDWTTNGHVNCIWDKCFGVGEWPGV